MKTTILASRDNYRESIDEERASWVKYILENLDVDTDELDELSGYDVFEILIGNGIDVVNYPDLGAVKISFGHDVIAEWGEPEFLMIRDNDSGEFYYKITIENWSIFDDENNYENDPRNGLAYQLHRLTVLPTCNLVANAR